MFFRMFASCNCSQAPVLTSPGVSPYNYISSATLSYSPATAGQATALTIGFTNIGTDMASGDSVLLHLPGFTGISRDAGQMSGLSGPSAGNYDIATSTWSSSAAKLTLKVAAAVTANQAESVVISTANQISLPLTTLGANDETLQISFEDVSSGGKSIAACGFGGLPHVCGPSRNRLCTQDCTRV